MKRSYGWVLSGLQSILAIALGFFAVVTVNLVATPIVELFFPGSLDSEGLPLTAPAQVLFLPLFFLAGMAGAFVVVLVAPRAPVAHALVFGALALITDLFVVVNYAEIWPSWFAVLLVLTVPPQIWLGAVLAVRARRRWGRSEG